MTFCVSLLLLSSMFGRSVDGGQLPEIFRHVHLFSRFLSGALLKINPGQVFRKKNEKNKLTDFLFLYFFR